MNSTVRHHPLTISFHWIIVAMLLLEFSAGWLMPDIRDGTTPEGILNFHMSWGVIILLVMLARLAWRFSHTLPPAHKSPHWAQDMAASSVHYLLYALVPCLTLTGWMIASAHGWNVSVFGVVTLPAIVAENEHTLRIAETAHVIVITLVLALIIAHAAASIYHHVILKDGIMRRMTFGKRM